jgi:hypothetical protein
MTRAAQSANIHVQLAIFTEADQFLRSDWLGSQHLVEGTEFYTIASVFALSAIVSVAKRYTKINANTRVSLWTTGSVAPP